jgi:cyclophilin family peptidyl-prolyl cis-trans isomerase
MHLFEDLAPQTTARIEQLVAEGYYNGLDFHRVLDGFVAQTGQTNGGNDTGVLLDDEVDTSLTYTSPGLLGMASRGPDTADAEFFITAIDGAGTADPVTLATMPQALDFRYTIFGQLVSGFDTFEKIMSAPVTTNPDTGEDSQPDPSITITSASLIDDTQDAVLRVFAPANFDGKDATITVTATNANNESSRQTFLASTVTDTNVDPPFLGAVSNQTTTQDTPASFSLTSTDLSSGGVTYTVVDPTTFTAPTDVSVSIDQLSGRVTLTPAAGFTGTINLLAGVRASLAEDAQANYDTQAFTLTVGANSTTPLASPLAPTGLAVDSSSDMGTFDGNGYVTTDTPELTATAESGANVQFKLNGAVIATAAETATGSGVYTATLSAGKLAVGTNLITATATTSDGTSADSTALSLIYAPSDVGGVYVVPGAPGTSQTLAVDWTEKNAAFNNEFGYFVVDSADGSIGGVAPGSAGYAQAALSSDTRTTLFAKGQKEGATSSATLDGGQMIVFYLIQNNTTANFLAKNPSNTVQGNNQPGAPLAFFSLEAANPDGMQHTQIVADSTIGSAQYNWEDLLNLGDSDFNDAAIVVQPSADASEQETLQAPGAGSTNVSLNATLTSEKQSTPSGDVGVYFVDDQAGTVNGLTPGDAGYAAAALASGNSQKLFAAGDSSTTEVAVPAGKFVAFYLITSGTTSDFVTNNPTNAAGAAQALFSFDAANPDSVNHFRWYTPGQQATDPSIVQLHIMTQLGGKASDFDSFAINLSFSV